MRCVSAHWHISKLTYYVHCTIHAVFAGIWVFDVRTH